MNERGAVRTTSWGPHILIRRSLHAGLVCLCSLIMLLCGRNEEALGNIIVRIRGVLVSLANLRMWPVQHYPLHTVFNGEFMEDMIVRSGGNDVVDRQWIAGLREESQSETAGFPCVKDRNTRKKRE